MSSLTSSRGHNTTARSTTSSSSRRAGSRSTSARGRSKAYYGSSSSSSSAAAAAGGSSHYNNNNHSSRGGNSGYIMKTHPLEGDGLITGFYQFLQRRNQKDLKSATEINIPDTIVYDHNFPRGWYTTETKSDPTEIVKKQGKELDSATILKFFAVPPQTIEKKNCSIVASYMSCSDIDDTPTTHVEFFTQTTLKEFVDRKHKREGILQKFVVPKGATRNTVIQAVWSPRVMCVWRRQNRMSLTTYDPNHPPSHDKEPYPMCVTYDGPSHYSEESTCASNVTEQIKVICSKIVSHFYATMEHKFLTRMVLYFKVDEYEQPWLLWCGSLRVADRDRPGPVTLNFAPRNDNSVTEYEREEEEFEKLHECDEHYVGLAQDALFNQKYHVGASLSRASSRSPSRQSTARGRSRGGAGGDFSPNSTARSSQSNTRSEMIGGFSSNTLPSTHQRTNRELAALAIEENSPTSQNSQSAEAWTKDPRIHDTYVDLCTARERVLSHLDDIFYEAYGHFLRYDPRNFQFSVESGVARLLGLDALGEAMMAGGVSKATPSSGNELNIDDEDLCFEIPKKRSGPISKIGDSVKAWVQRHYTKLIADLKDEAASILPSSAGSSYSNNNNNSSSNNNNKKAVVEEEKEEASANTASSTSATPPESNIQPPPPAPAAQQEQQQSAPTLEEEEEEEKKPPAAPAKSFEDDYKKRDPEPADVKEYEDDFEGDADEEL